MVVLVPKRFSRIDCAIGPTLSLALVTEIFKTKSTHVSFHANKIQALDLYVSPHYLSKNKDEEAIRMGAQELVYVMELDLSFNSLHEGYSLPRPGHGKKVPLLGLCTNLVSLNLASNGLSQTSFVSLFGSCAGEGLARLRTLDLSHNEFAELPRELYTTCPSLQNLTAMNNKLTSLKSLLQTLLKYRGKLETVQFTSKNAVSGRNSVCLKDLYREKVIFVLGTQLVRLDCNIINSWDHEKAHRGLSLYSNDRIDKMHIQAHTSPASLVCSQPQHEAFNQVECDRKTGSDHGEVEVLNRGSRHTVENGSSAERIKALEEQVASLAGIIEHQVSDTTSYEARGCDDNPASSSMSPSVEVGDDAVNSRKSAAMRESQRTAAIFVFKSIIDNIVSRKRQHTNRNTVFFLWLIVTRFRRTVLMSKEQAIETEKKWQNETQLLVRKAIDEEVSKGTRQLELTKATSSAMISKLKLKMKLLDGRLEEHRKNEEKSIEAANMLKSKLHIAEEALKKDSTENGERACLAEVEVDRLRRELQLRKEALDEEEYVNSSEIQRLKRAHKDAMELITTNAAHVNQLKSEVIKKDDTIKSIKDAYEQAARRSAADRSRCEQACASEQQAKELLARQAVKLQETEAEVGRVETEYQARQTELMSEVEERKLKYKEVERRMKSALGERDDMQTQLEDCNRIKSRTEEKNTQLETQLDRATDEMRKTKQATTVERHLLDDAVSRATDLKHSMDRLRESSQQLEQELRIKKEENKLLRQNVARYDKMVKSLSGKLVMVKRDWDKREKEIENTHRLEVRMLRDQTDRELSSMNHELKAERSLRLEIEQSVAATETKNEKQRLKMRDAIECLAKQLVGGEER